MSGHGRPRVSDAMVRNPKVHGPSTSIGEIRALFDDEHVHIALIVALDGRLLTTIDRRDIENAGLSDDAPARDAGTLAGRTIAPLHPLGLATDALLSSYGRRLAVVDNSGRLLGLLCLKKDGSGYCSDDSIRERAAARPALAARLSP
jgi:hypothetical protein